MPLEGENGAQGGAKPLRGGMECGRLHPGAGPSRSRSRRCHPVPCSSFCALFLEELGRLDLSGLKAGSPGLFWGLGLVRGMPCLPRDQRVPLAANGSSQCPLPVRAQFSPRDVTALPARSPSMHTSSLPGVPVPSQCSPTMGSDWSQCGPSPIPRTAFPQSQYAHIQPLWGSNAIPVQPLCHPRTIPVQPQYHQPLCHLRTIPVPPLCHLRAIPVQPQYHPRTIPVQPQCHPSTAPLWAQPGPSTDPLLLPVLAPPLGSRSPAPSLTPPRAGTRPDGQLPAGRLTNPLPPRAGSPPPSVRLIGGRPSPAQ